MDIKPFKISIPDEELELLRQKLALTRLPTSIAHARWTESKDNNVSVPFLAAVLEFWRDGYDWRLEEARLNTQLPQFTTEIPIEGFTSPPLQIHFVHARAEASDAVPLLFFHGWPGSINELSRALPLLTARGFHVVAPSNPGWLFSPHPDADSEGFRMPQHAEYAHALMQKLGYDKFLVQGGDWGGHLAPMVAKNYPDSVLGLHMNSFPMLPVPTASKNGEKEFTAFEKNSLARFQWWFDNERGYSAVQGTKPLTLGIGLHDSPIGMLAWMADKLFVWTDCTPKNPQGHDWTHTELITWTLLHYFALDGPTGSFGMYKDNRFWNEADDRFIGVPTGVSAFAQEMEMVPQSCATDRAHIVWWREHALGGHFAMYERPEDMASDLADFARSLGMMR